MNVSPDLSLLDQVRSLQQQVSQLQSLIPGAGLSYGQGQGGVGARRLEMKQEVVAATAMAFSTTSTSYVDITNGTVNITTTGGFVEIEVVGDDTNAAVLLFLGAASGSYGSYKALIDSISLSVTTFGFLTASLSGWASWSKWRYLPTAGDHVIKLQGLSSNAAVTVQFFGHLKVTEYFSQAASTV